MQGSALPSPWAPSANLYYAFGLGLFWGGGGLREVWKDSLQQSRISGMIAQDQFFARRSLYIRMAEGKSE